MQGIESVTEDTRSACKNLVEYIHSVEASLKIIVVKFKASNHKSAYEDLIDFADNMNLVLTAIIEIIEATRLGEKSLSIDQFEEGLGHLVTSLKEFTNRQVTGNVAALVSSIEEEIIPSLKTWRTFYIPSLEQSIEP